MKLASLKEGGRNGSLIVVSRNLKKGVRVPEIAATLQEAIDNWMVVTGRLREVYTVLNSEKGCPGSFELDMNKLAAPLPRAYQWADGSAYVNHVELVRRARGATLPENFWTDPLIYQGGSDCFVGPRDPILVENSEWGIDFEAEVAVITDDVPMGVSVAAAAGHIKLLLLVNDVSLRNLIPHELAKGFGFFQGKPATAFSPVAVTPEELGGAWQEGRVHLPLITRLNGNLFGQPNAGVDMTFNFPQLIHHAAMTRFLGAGTIIGSGTVSNLDRSRGSSCLAEKRMLEILAQGEAKTPFMSFGDEVEIEMCTHEGHNIFGTIHQRVEPYCPPLDEDPE